VVALTFWAAAPLDNWAMGLLGQRTVGQIDNSHSHREVDGDPLRRLTGADTEVDEGFGRHVGEGIHVTAGEVWIEC
jgi:hypothetical protein